MNGEAAIDRPDGKAVVLVLGRITDRMRSRLEERFELIADDAIDTRGGDVRGVAVGMGGSCKADVIDQLPNARVIANYGVGYDAVDAEHAAKKGVVVTHTPGVLNDDVANTAILLLLATDRRLVAYDRYVREGRWEAEGSPPLTRGIRGRLVGIVGLGRIGSTIAEKLEGAFGARIAYHGRSEKDVPYRYYADLVEMARAADALIVVTPGGPETEGLVSAEVIDALGPKGTLVNVARGTVIDEAAMVSALEDGRLGAAGLDVFEKEPSVPDALTRMDNVVLTPHVGSATEETRQAMGDLVCENIELMLDGKKPKTPVPESRELIG